MKILGIETSCDETALAIVEADGGFEAPQFKILSEALISQTAIHEKYGGVYPMMAKREHSKNLIPLLEKLLSQTETKNFSADIADKQEKIEKILEREPELLEQFLDCVPAILAPDIEAIAVTSGPGLEPALWVGINFAKALGLVWNLPVIPTNHMEGHIVSALQNGKPIEFPALALLVSGGHTELVLIEEWQKYRIIGRTRDDAVGEAFDKVARMMDLPYPGGPEISRLAEEGRSRQLQSASLLPRPMIKSDNYDFSFSGLKTSILYTIQKMTDEEKNDPDWKIKMAREFEDSVTEVLVAKTERAIKEFGAKTLIIGGGVIANKHLRQQFEELARNFPDTELFIPDSNLTTDNAIMIAMAGYFNYLTDKNPAADFRADGNLVLK